MQFHRRDSQLVLEKLFKPPDSRGDESQGDGRGSNGTDSCRWLK